MLNTLLVAVAVLAATFALLAVLFRAQARRFDRLVATDLLDRWAAHLRRHPQAVPPAEVLAAMVALPGPAARRLTR